MRVRYTDNQCLTIHVLNSSDRNFSKKIISALALGEAAKSAKCVSVGCRRSESAAAADAPSAHLQPADYGFSLGQNWCGEWPWIRCMMRNAAATSADLFLAASFSEAHFKLRRQVTFYFPSCDTRQRAILVLFTHAARAYRWLKPSREQSQNFQLIQPALTGHEARFNYK